MSEELDNKVTTSEAENGAVQNSEPPVDSQVIQKKSFSKKIASALMSEDYKGIGKNIWRNIVWPATQRILVKSFEAIIYHGKIGPSSLDDRTDYGSFYDGGGGSLRGSESRVISDFGEIRFRSQQAAERVLDTMYARLRQNKIITVADYYKIAGQTPQYTYYNYGWTNLNSARIFHYTIKGERFWCIRLPEPMYVERTN